MPVVSRTLKNRGVQRDGSVRVRERIIDAKGRNWDRVYRAVSEAQAIADMNALDLADQLTAADFRDLLAWTQDKNDPGAFDFTDRDLALLEGEERLLVWFAESLGGKALTLAWWIESLNPSSYTAIRVRVGFDSVTGSRIQDRAIDLAACEVRFDVVESI